MFSGLTSRCITFLERKKQRVFKHRYKITPIASLLNRSSLLYFAKSLSHGLEYDLAVIVERDMKQLPADAILGDTAINVTYPFVAAENEALARIEAAMKLGLMGLNSRDGGRRRRALGSSRIS